VTYIWDGTKYTISTSLPPDLQLQLNISKKVILKFTGIVDPDEILSGNDIKVFIDGVEWSGNYVERTSNTINITLDEPYIQTQRLITFQSEKGTPKVRYAIKSRVYQDNDVWISKIGLDEQIPILGTPNYAEITNPPYDYSFILNPTNTENTEQQIISPIINYVDLSPIYNTIDYNISYNPTQPPTTIASPTYSEPVQIIEDATIIGGGGSYIPNYTDLDGRVETADASIRDFTNDIR
jgi:hypothetical protein